MLKAICAGFRETTEPAVCLTDGEITLIFAMDSFVDFHIFVLDILALSHYMLLVI